MMNLSLIPFLKSDFDQIINFKFLSIDLEEKKF